MFILSHLNSTPPESMKSQVLQMVVDYLSDISPVSLTPSNPLYQLYQYVIGFEVHLYLEAMSGQSDSPTQLILALDEQDPAQVLGFALYLPCQDDPSACTVAYLAVREAQRESGIARAMLNKIITAHPQVELACVASQVATFERMGFQALAAHGPQVLMNTFDYRCNGMVAVQDLAPIYQSKEVHQIHAYLLKQHGQTAMKAAERQRDLLLDQLSAQAKALLALRRH